MAEFIDAPHTAIRQAMESTTNSPSTGGWLLDVKQRFAEALSMDDALLSVPWLTAQAHRSGTIKPNTLVRYVGMVQDVFEPELYAPSLVAKTKSGTHTELGAFRDTINESCEPIDMKNLQSRYSYYLVPPPGEAPWARAVHTATTVQSSGAASRSDAPPPASAAAKRGRAEAGDSGAASGAGEHHALPPPAPGSFANVGAASPFASMGALGESGELSGGGGSAAQAAAASLQLPLLSDPEVPVLMRVYPAPSEGEPALRLCELVEVIGIFTADPVLAVFHAPAPGSSAAAAEHRHCREGDMDAEGAEGGGDDGAGAGMEEDGELGEGGGELGRGVEDEMEAASRLATNPPPSLVPRVQAVLVRRLSPSYPALPAGQQQQLGAAGWMHAPAAAAGGSAFPSSSSSAAAPSGEQAPGGDPAYPTIQAALSAAALGAPPPSALAPTVAQVRALAIRFTTAACGGDPVAGEFLLLHLISRVYGRPDGLALGKLTLALTGFPEHLLGASSSSASSSVSSSSSAAASSSSSGGPAAPPPQPPLPLETGASPAGRRLAASLGAVVPRTALIPLRLDVLNGLAFCPSKGADIGRLQSGLLQLPEGSHLLVDETVMAEGTLSAAGVSGLHALEAVAAKQRVDYLFPFCAPSPWPVDLPLLLLVAGQKSLIKADAVVPLPQEAVHALVSLPGSGGSSTAAGGAEEEGQLRLVRAFIASARCASFTLTQDACEAIQAAWLAARRGSGPAAVTDEDLHRWLTLCRLSAVSHGEEGLSAARLAAVLQLERARAARCAALAAAKGGAAGGAATTAEAEAGGAREPGVATPLRNSEADGYE